MSFIAGIRLQNQLNEEGKRTQHGLRIRTIRIYDGTKVRVWLWHRRWVCDPFLEDSHNFIEAFRHSHMACQSHHCWSQHPADHHQSHIERTSLYFHEKQRNLIFLFVFEGAI
jgi:hypothetical protein